MAWRVEAHADLALLRGVGVHAEQDVESLSLFGGDENFDDLLGLNGNRIRRHQARGDAVGARGGSADARDGRSSSEGIAAEKRVLNGREERRRLGQQGPGCGFCRNRILAKLPEQRVRAASQAKTLRDRDGKANGVVGFGLLLDDGPVGRERETHFLEISSNAGAMSGFHAHGERFAGNDVAAIGDSVEAHAGNEDQRGIDLLALAASAADERLDRSRNLVGKRRHRNFVESFACGNEEVGGGLEIETQGGVARADEGGIDRAHQRINCPASYLEIFIQGTKGLGKRRRIPFRAVFAFEGDGAAQKRRVEKPGDSLRAVVGEGVESDFAPGLAVEGRNVVQGQGVTLRLFAAVYIE